jgi:hypothetical protein
MKQTIKDQLTKQFVKIYEPIMCRIETFRAIRKWKRGVKLCEAEQRRLNGPRFYMWYDRKTGEFVPLVYERRPKADATSMKGLQIMGKIKAKRSMKVEDMKRESFYYTASKHGAHGCKDNNKLRSQKLNEWVEYYLTHVSEPIAKIRQYKTQSTPEGRK